MDLKTYKKAGDLLLEIQRTDEILEYFRKCILTDNGHYKLVINGLHVNVTQEFFKMLEIFIGKRIEELNVRFEEL